jgi:hypothetical protein
MKNSLLFLLTCGLVSQVSAMDTPAAPSASPEPAVSEELVPKDVAGDVEGTVAKLKALQVAGSAVKEDEASAADENEGDNAEPVTPLTDDKKDEAKF